MKNNAFLEQVQRGRNDFWRYLLVTGLIIFVSFWISLLASIITIYFEGTDINQYSEIVLLILGLIPFPFLLLTLWAGTRFLHKRSFLSLITPLKHIRWGRIFFAFGVWFILAIISDVVLSIFQPGNYRWSFDPIRFIPYFILAIILLPIQTSTEELVFRGYFTQAFSRLSPQIWLPLIVPSIVFGLLHSLNPEVGMYGFLLTIPYYIGFGLMLGWLTIQSQSLELSLGIHLANNLYASFAVTFPGSALASPALFSIQKYDPVASLIVFFVMAAVFILIMLTVGKRWFIPPTNDLEGTPFIPTIE
jgi:membrane protease YdiL (CAAX protease family)